MVSTALKIDIEKENDDFLYEIRQNRLLHNISNKVLDLFENNYHSVGFVCLNQSCLQRELILSLSTLLSRRRGEKTVDVYLSNEKDGESKKDALLNGKVQMQYLADFLDNQSALISKKRKIWDLPSMTVLVKSYEQYLDILEDINVIFVLISKTGTNKDEVIALREYFQNFDIEVQGLVLEKKDKPAWWEFWK